MSENARATLTVAVSHNSAEGTRVRAPRSNPAIAAILLAHGFCWSYRLGHWALPGSCGLAYCRQQRDVSEALRAAGVHVLIAEASIDTPPAIAQRPPSEGIIALRYEAYATFTAQRRLFERLLARLRALGGQRLVIPPAPDPELPALLGPHARIFTGADAVLQPATPNECHRNTVALWLAGGTKITCGYALSPDGVWVQHTWGLGPDDRVIETTVARALYVGVVLDGERAVEFASANHP